MSDIDSLKQALLTAEIQMKEAPEGQKETKLNECLHYAMALYEASEPIENKWLLLLSYDHLRKGDGDWIVKNTSSDDWAQDPGTWGLILISIFAQYREFGDDYKRMLAEYDTVIPVAECALLNEPVMRNAALSCLYANKAFAEHKLGQDPSATASVNVSLNYMPNPLAHEIRASMYLGQDSFTVISAISQAVSLRCHAKAWHLVNRANAYLEIGNEVLANQDLQAVQEDERGHEWHLAMGLLLAKVGRDSEAIFSYEQALVTDRTYEALTNLASVRYGQSLFQHAENLLLEAIELAPATDWRPRFNLALVYNDLEQYEKAEALFQGVRLSETDWDLQHIASRWLFRREDWAGAIDLLKAALRRAANVDERSTTLNDLGVAYHKLGNISMARAYFNMACNSDPTNTTAVNNMLLLAAAEVDETVKEEPELASRKPTVLNLKWLRQQGMAAVMWVDDWKIIERAHSLYKMAETMIGGA